MIVTCTCLWYWKHTGRMWEQNLYFCSFLDKISHFLILCSISALTCASKAGNQVSYHYEARIVTGMPQVRGQAAGTGIQAEVLVEYLQKGKLAVKVS